MVSRVSQFRAVFFMVIAMAVIATGCGGTPYAAKVNETTISAAQMNADLDAIRNNKVLADSINQQYQQSGSGLQPGGPNTLNAQFVASFVNAQVQSALVHQYVVDQHITVPDDSVNALMTQMNEAPGMKDLPESFRKRFAQQDAEVVAASRDYVSRHPDRFQLVCSRHILVDTKEKANELRGRILGGEDFATIARAESKDNGGGQGDGGSAKEGGTLPCMPAGSFVKPFADALESGEVNKLSEPIQTDFGFHLIEVMSRKPVPYEQIGKNPATRGMDPVSILLSELSKDAKVKVNSRYGKLTRQSSPDGAVMFTVTPHESTALREGSSQSERSMNPSEMGQLFPTPNQPAPAPAPTQTQPAPDAQ